MTCSVVIRGSSVLITVSNGQNKYADQHFLRGDVQQNIGWKMNFNQINLTWKMSVPHTSRWCIICVFFFASAPHPPVGGAPIRGNVYTEETKTMTMTTKKKTMATKPHNHSNRLTSARQPQAPPNAGISAMGLHRMQSAFGKK